MLRRIENISHRSVFDYLAVLQHCDVVRHGADDAEIVGDEQHGQLTQSDYADNGTSVVFSRTTLYDYAGKQSTEWTSTVKPDGTYNTSATFNYSTASGEYLLGAVATSLGATTKNGGSYSSTTTTNTYQWWDGAVQSTISVANTYGTTTTTFGYDGLGRLTSAYISDGRSRSVSFKTDGDGQIIRRDEQDGNYSNGDPHEAWYRFGGRQMAYVGNNGSTNMGEAASVIDRGLASGSGAFRNGASWSTSYADTTGSYDAINSYRQGSSAGSYTVRQTGETLASIAQGLWGDASLWYKLAEANGLAVDAGLVEGQRLTVPAGVIRDTFNANTVKPYDPASAIGDVSPTPVLPPAPKKKGCGIGQIFLAIIAVAVTLVTAGAAVAALAPAGSVTGGILGGIGAIVGLLDRNELRPERLNGVVLAKARKAVRLEGTIGCPGRRRI